ncbi:MAG: F0F1 ATP synthase subunit delta [Rhodocyclaceae bacterium]|nr:F0F1 ATP synthase subunit delta [Rhodocyclaceae bacterium]
MAENATLARPYAEAAFALAKATQRLTEWQDALARLAIAAQDAQLSGCFSDPRYTPDALAELICAAVGEISPEQRNFIMLLIENRRLAVLPEIYRLFEALKDADEHALKADIHTAFPLTDAQLAELTAALERRMRAKVKARMIVDPRLIGGVKIAIGDEVIDASVRGKLDAMAIQLKN